MSASVPLSGTPSYSDWLFLAQLANALATGGVNATNPFLPALAANKAPVPIGVPGGATAGAFIPYPSMNLIVLADGSDMNRNWPATWFLSPPTKFLSGLIPPFSYTPAIVNGAAQPIFWGTISPELQTWGGAPTVVAGYGRWGAVAVEVAALIVAAGYSVQGVYVIGAPQSTGQGPALTALGSKTFQLQNDTDAFTAFYPTPTYTPPSPNPYGYPWNADLTPLENGAAPLGTVSTMNTNGQMTAGTNGISPDAAIRQLLVAAPPAHAIGEYVRRLGVVWPLAGDLNAGANGYLEPWLIGQLAQPAGPGLAPLPTPAGATTKGMIAAYQSALACISICP